MKRLLLIVFVVFCFASSAQGELASTAITTGEQTADGAMFSGSANITAIQVITDGTNDGKVVVYDNTAGSGKVVFECTVTGASHYGGRVFVPPIEVYTGIYADISGTGASYIIEYARD